MNGLHATDRDGRATLAALPHLDDIDGVYVSFALPNLIVVRTDENARRGQRKRSRARPSVRGYSSVSPAFAFPASR